LKAIETHGPNVLTSIAALVLIIVVVTIACFVVGCGNEPEQAKTELVEQFTTQQRFLMYKQSMPTRLEFTLYAVQPAEWIYQDDDAIGYEYEIAVTVYDPSTFMDDVAYRHDSPLFGRSIPPNWRSLDPVEVLNEEGENLRLAYILSVRGPIMGHLDELEMLPEVWDALKAGRDLEHITQLNGMEVHYRLIPMKK